MASDQPWTAMSMATTEQVDYFSPLTTELLVEIACDLPSLQDVLLLSATAKRFRMMIEEDMNYILYRLRFPAWRKARRLLADQGGPAMDAPIMTARAIVKILRNQQALDRTMEKFVAHIVCPMQRNLSPETQKWYGTTARPSHLTPTEKIRFYRSWYDVWSLMTIPETQWDERLNTITSLKQLALLREICSVGGLRPTSQAEDLLSIFISETTPEYDSTRCKASRLFVAILERAENVYQTNPSIDLATWKSCILSKKRLRWYGFQFIWDHSQDWQFMKHTSRPRMPPYREFLAHCEAGVEMWDEDTDDEFQ